MRMRGRSATTQHHHMRRGITTTAATVHLINGVCMHEGTHSMHPIRDRTAAQLLLVLLLALCNMIDG